MKQTIKEACESLPAVNEDLIFNIALIKLMKSDKYKHDYNYRLHCLELLSAPYAYYGNCTDEDRSRVGEAYRLVHLADKGDAQAQAIVSVIPPAWEEAAQDEWDLVPGDECEFCKQTIGGKSGGKRRSKADADSDDKEGKPYTPSVKPGSATEIAWQALVALSKEDEPVAADSWRDAALVALARSERVSDPVAAFRDAKRNLKGQRAFEEAKNGSVQRRLTVA